MFNPKKFFSSQKSQEKGLTSLNLQSDSPPKREAPSSSASEDFAKACAAFEARYRGSPKQKEIDRRVNKILNSGVVPEHIFYGVIPAENQVIVMMPPGTEHRTLMLFSSGFIATDYLRANRLTAVVGMFKPSALATLAESWKASGVDSYSFNRCPRCTPLSFICPKDGLLTEKELRLMWAVSVALKGYRGEMIVREFLATDTTEMAKRRALLESIRDHVDYGIPYVHWLIGMIAGMQGDDAAREGSIARLSEFGPQFWGKIIVAKDAADMEAWGKSMIDAHFGLLGTYGLLEELKHKTSGKITTLEN